MTQIKKQTEGEGISDEIKPDMGDVYRDSKSGLVRYISQFFKRTQDAEDVVQEAFVKVIEAQRKREIKAPKAYLYQTARNTAIEEVKKKSFKLTDMLGDSLPDLELGKTATMEEQFEVRENFEVYCRAVRSLPVKCRRAYVLCRIYGFTQKEAAEHMGISLKGIEGHLTRATRRCMDFVETEQANNVLTKSARSEGRIHEQC